MCEMLEIIQKLLLMIGLFYFAWQDYHTYTIGIIPAVIVSVIGLTSRLLMAGDLGVIIEVGTSMLIGVILIFIGYLSKESIGIGDGILFLVSGCYMGIVENLILLERTIILTGGFVAICLMIRKLRKNDRIPMAPFMLVAYVTTFLS